MDELFTVMMQPVTLVYDLIGPIFFWCDNVLWYGGLVSQMGLAVLVSVSCWDRLGGIRTSV